jgi:hypothetical protein
MLDDAEREQCPVAVYKRGQAPVCSLAIVVPMTSSLCEHITPVPIGNNVENYIV